MGLIFGLWLVACAGVVYGLYLRKREGERRVADLIADLEREAGLNELPRAGGSAAERARGLVSAASLRTYEQKLLWAGRPYGLDGGQFAALKLVTAVALPALIPVLALFQMSSATFLAMAFAALAGFILPDVWLGARLAQRQRMVAEELPLFTDLVATAIGAGLPMADAVRRVAADVPGIVAREFLRAVQEMAAGKPRMEAWRDLIARVPGDEVRTIVNAIMNAEQFGTSVAEILRYQVQQIRLFKQQEAQRIAQATTVKMRIPMLLLILVPFMVLLLGPALLQIAKLLL